MLVLVFNISSSWIIDIYYLKNKSSVQQERLLENKNNLKIYSMDFSIEDVWKIGNEIRSLKDYPKDEKILYLGNIDLIKILKEYEINKVYEKDEKIIYELDRKEKI